MALSEEEELAERGGDPRLLGRILTLTAAASTSRWPPAGAPPGMPPAAAANDWLVQRLARSTEFCHMAHLVSRPKIVVPVALALAASIVLAVAAWAATHAHAGGDPGGRLMAKIAPVVRVVPGLEHGRIPWWIFLMRPYCPGLDPRHRTAVG